jgi:methionine-rich copper-binding protein CopC
MLLATVCATASAHTGVIAVQPADNAMLDTAPRAVSVVFTAEVYEGLAGLIVMNEQGGEISIGTVDTTDAHRMEARLPERMPPGQYRINWNVVADDGHFSEGHFTFTLEPPDAAAQAGATAHGTAATRPASAHDAQVIRYTGFGPALFGASEEAVRQAWGRPLNKADPAPGSSCYYLTMDPMPPERRGIAFMIEHDGFMRYDVDVPSPAAPGNIVVGDSADAVRAAHNGRIEEQPHKYDPAKRVLIVTPPGGGISRLVFEIDGEGRVASWRIGVPPQVYYVEGCG